MARTARRFVAIVTITVGCVAAIHSAPASSAGGVSGTGGPLHSSLTMVAGGVSGTGGPLHS